MNIDEMEAGPELDVLVAEKIFGFHGIGYYKPTKPKGGHLDNELAANREEALKVTQEMWGREDVGCVDLCHWQDDWGPLFVPEYSTDIAAAWEIADKMAKEKFSIDVVSMPSPPHEPGIWRVFINDKQDRNFDGEGQGAPLAICRAALKACGVVEVG